MLKTPSSTVIGGAGIWTPSAWKIGLDVLNLGQLIRNLFSNSEQGFAYDINDLSTLYQDAAGTIPVTGAGQPVGLVLDKSKGLVLGGERVTGGNFEGGLIGSKSDGIASVSTWELNTVSPISGTKDGKLSITTPASGRPILSFLTPVKNIGALYEISFDYKVLSGTVSIFGVFNGATTNISPATLSGSGKFKTRYTALEAVADDLIYFGNSAGTIQIDNISVRQVLGNHAYQTTPSMRPLLQNSPRKIDYDGVDDKLTVSLPAQLTGCTVIRAVPNVGTQILTNQTIATPYNDSTDHCGLIVINRALTQTETTQITQIFNRLAGV